MYQADLYRKYFLHQCENHPDLQHAAVAGSRVFQTIGVEEALGDFRSGAKEKGIIFRLIDYTYVITDGGSPTAQIQKEIQGGFIVAKYYSNRQGGQSEMYEAMDDAERITDEILEKMIADSLNGHPLFNFTLDSRQEFTVNPIGYVGDTSYAGWMALFRFSNHWRNCLSDESAPAWLDDGVTPHEL